MATAICAAAASGKPQLLMLSIWLRPCHQPFERLYVVDEPHPLPPFPQVSRVHLRMWQRWMLTTVAAASLSVLTAPKLTLPRCAARISRGWSLAGQQ